MELKLTSASKVLVELYFRFNLNSSAVISGTEITTGAYGSKPTFKAGLDLFIVNLETVLNSLFTFANNSASAISGASVACTARLLTVKGFSGLKVISMPPSGSFIPVCRLPSAIDEIFEITGTDSITAFL